MWKHQNQQNQEAVFHLLKTTFPLPESVYYQVKDRVSSATPEAIPGRHHISEVFSWWPVLKFQYHRFFLFFVFQTIFRLIRKIVIHNSETKKRQVSLYLNIANKEFYLYNSALSFPPIANYFYGIKK